MSQFNCPNCGYVIQDGMFVCPNCNANFTARQAANVPTTAPTYQPSVYPIPVQQPKKKIKWWMIAIAVVVLLLMMKACFGSSSSENGAAANHVSNSEKADTSEKGSNNEVEKGVMKNKGTLGDYEVEILSAKKTKDYDGKPAIIIDYQFTNNSDEATSFMVALIDKAFQDGIELESAIVVNTKVYDADESMKDIKPGKSLKVQQAFLLNDSKTPVEVEVSELISFSNEKVVKTFELQ